MREGGKRKGAPQVGSRRHKLEQFFYGVCRRLPTCLTIFHDTLFHPFLCNIGSGNFIGKWGPFPTRRQAAKFPPTFAKVPPFSRLLLLDANAKKVYTVLLTALNTTRP